MKLRARVDAILVGAGTVRADDPSLTIRGLRKITQPWRVVWAPRGRPPAQAKIFTDRHRARTLVLPHRTLRAALRELARRGIQSVLVEGGGHTLGKLFDARLANEVTFYIAPLLTGGATPSLGGRGPSPLRNAVTITTPHYTLLGTNLRIQGLVSYGGA
jgi:diaminohydroxyphosphoribosylaminopyrimidine deaminase/5-amino-6-(5-phosphoribosylamino)uracil reductase